MKGKKVKVKMDEEPGEKEEIKEEAVIMKGKKKTRESKVIYVHTINADVGVAVWLHSLKLGTR
jgi:hypothetical protein